MPPTFKHITVVKGCQLGTPGWKGVFRPPRIMGDSPEAQGVGGKHDEEL